MSQPSDSSGLTSGDPLAAQSGGYTSPPPPGAGGPATAYAAPPPVAGRLVLASWGRRVAAFLIDGVIVGVGALILLVAITAPFSVGFFASDSTGVAALIVGFLVATLSITIVAFLYAPALMARTNGQTFGRMAAGTRVVRADGRPITFGFAMVREVVVKALLFGLLGGITGGILHLLDVLWPLWDEENRALHDFVVNTRTVLT
jgi:uncharacterized RDD family membrane protein YckC